MPTIKDALDIIGKLTVAEQESLKTMLLSPAFVKSLNIEDFVAKERFANGRVCPLCGCIHVVRNGHRKDGTQRYVCKDCGKSFVIATNSIVSGTRKDLSVWEQYIDCMMNGLSIRKTAVACGIHRNTAFLWRHKILDALQNMADDVTLDGIIEADETFFAISYKGNHSKSKTFAMPRKAHKRGHSTHIRGLSQEKVCVPCAVNRNGLSISKITNTGRVSTRDLHHIYDGRIKTNSTLVTDKMNSYVRFTNANGIDLVQLKTGKAKKGIYNIQHINSYHSQLKRFMRGFNGVSTKYLNNYSRLSQILLTFCSGAAEALRGKLSCKNTPSARVYRHSFERQCNFLTCLFWTKHFPHLTNWGRLSPSTSISLWDNLSQS